MQLHHPEKSTLAEHSINLAHHIQFNYTTSLAKKFRRMECLIREAIEIELHSDNMNREECPV